MTQISRPADRGSGMYAHPRAGSAGTQLLGRARPPMVALRRRAPYRFTARDAELLGLVATNTSQEEIAARLGCSVSTIERRLSTLREELGVQTTIQVVVAAVRAGVV